MAYSRGSSTRLATATFHEARTRVGRKAYTGAWSARMPHQQFYDAFPEIPGTLPEKILYNELAARHLNFHFQVNVGDIPYTHVIAEHARPDFLLPDYHIIINVQSPYWHSLPGAYEHDWFQAELFQIAGYKTYGLISDDIIRNVSAAVDTIPELKYATIHGDTRLFGINPGIPRPPHNIHAGRGPKESLHLIGRNRKDRMTAAAMFRVAPAPRGARKTRGPVFTVANFTQVELNELAAFGKRWDDYVKALGEYFTGHDVSYWWMEDPTDPAYGGHWVENVDTNRFARYPWLYFHWLRWRSWKERLSTSVNIPAQGRADVDMYVQALGKYFHDFPDAKHVYGGLWRFFAFQMLPQAEKILKFRMLAKIRKLRAMGIKVGGRKKKK